MVPVTPKERLLLKLALSASPDCASLAQLERLDEADANVWEHVASCPRCQTEWTLLNAFEAAKPDAGEQADVSWISDRLMERFSLEPERKAPVPPRRRWPRFRALSAGLAAAAMLLAVAVGVGLRERHSPDVAAPSVLEERTLRSGEILALGPEGELDRLPSELRWQPVDGAASYSIRLMEVDRSVLWAAETAAASAALPPPVLAQVVPGKPLLWQVIAKDAKGSTVAESPVQRFRLQKTQP
jgi:hypothetical protein